ncbi:T9SS type A sorting domain-containing protein [Chryseobacterium sp. KMC2]|uniref:T9SS type A sorting domain-containing protein n=1 Tax=Chryseobacterium sp. KMC2 TaxID=2800705 RepID=UPI0019218DFF|nr:T9SS type A sorting domain-containing protein [Chryseobacterium sp. KMC2]MBL3550138.1 T9SS type A sorting domain-containing protein [Chryseobacterium sp. KMC2]
MKRIYVILVLIVPLLSFAQGENDNWYFGQYAGVNFSGPTPTALTDSQMYAEEAVGTVSDKNGKLLFYTNGVDIYNRQHQVMLNGSSIGGGLSTQQLVIAKNPAYPGQYYVFTAAEISTPGSYVAYTIVDMNQGDIGGDGHPLGKVLTNAKRIPILDSSGNKIKTEAITIEDHADTYSFWILVPNGNTLYSYRLSASGFNPVPVVSGLGLSSPLDETKYFGIKVSPQIDYGKGFTNYLSLNMWIPSNYYMNKVYSFERSTGQITNHFSLDVNTSISYISEFSSYGKIMYLGRDKIYAINLGASTSFPVYNQIYSGAPGINFYGIQRNISNTDIYLSTPHYGYLSKINNPDNYGGSSVNLNAIDLKGKLTYLGLPQNVYLSNAGATECIIDLALQNPETYSGHTYSVNNYIITSNNYTVDHTNQSIIMKAENYISLLPNTEIKTGSDFFATIAPCEVLAGKMQRASAAVSNQKISLTLDLRETPEESSINIYPNPASDFIKIDTRSKVLEWEIYDLSGKIVLKGNGEKIEVKSMIKGAYLLNITLEKGKKITKKIIVN